MIMFLIRTAIFVVSAALGILVADWILADFNIVWGEGGLWGFILAVVIYAILQSVLAPWTARFAQRNAPALLGGVGIVSTFLALFVVWLLPIDAIEITGWIGWVLGPVIVWLVTALATLLLPMFFIKEKVQDRKNGK
ncbi:hypothetical protein ACFQRL_02855 [Microbacterium fluvii]|uniref:4 TMS phage holin, superfamily IV n=1 Tax=Microbacterium fluvii TaxID=415215 RepID=A0ABW2H979_9MICO|nr:hypothetical protein [Microbacterium fluvii]MCU4671532.1 hypothetical protein [Microbacterium fluvii]